MKPLCALLITALLGLGVAACGSTSATIATSGSYLKKDGDKDFDDDGPQKKVHTNDDAVLLAASGGEPGERTKQAITAVVKRYYAAAAAEDGATACSLLYSTLANAVASSQTVTASAGGKTCAAAMSLLYKQQHVQLAADNVATMLVTGVHVKGNLGLAVLGFRTMPEGEILVELEGGAWKIDSLLDSLMP
ncbi:MAG: hypothetical protein WBQ21_12790 [Solirubrobacteraceae bacterium]